MGTATGWAEVHKEIWYTKSRIGTLIFKYGALFGGMIELIAIAILYSVFIEEMYGFSTTNIIDLLIMGSRIIHVSMGVSLLLSFGSRLPQNAYSWIRLLFLHALFIEIIVNIITPIYGAIANYLFGRVLSRAYYAFNALFIIIDIVGLLFFGSSGFFRIGNDIKFKNGIVQRGLMKIKSWLWAIECIDILIIVIYMIFHLVLLSGSSYYSMSQLSENYFIICECIFLLIQWCLILSATSTPHLDTSVLTGGVLEPPNYITMLLIFDIVFFLLRISIFIVSLVSLIFTIREHDILITATFAAIHFIFSVLQLIIGFILVVLMFVYRGMVSKAERLRINFNKLGGILESGKDDDDDDEEEESYKGDYEGSSVTNRKK